MMAGPYVCAGSGHRTKPMNTRIRRHPVNGFWAVTCFFNPGRFARRRHNHRLFRAHLPLPLICVELSHDGEYELEKDDADVLIQIHSPHVMWQKERLLNLAIAALPPACTKVAWLDHDILFDREDWHRDADRLLDRYSMLQLFSRFTDLPPETTDIFHARSQTSPSGHSFAHLYASASAHDDLFYTKSSNVLEIGDKGIHLRRNRSAGLAWAAHRALLERHGLYDACVIGSGDRAVTCAAYGRHDRSSQAWLRNERQLRHYYRWAAPFSRTVNGSVSCVEGEIFHLWHGDIEDRGYLDRHLGLERYRFDPFGDVMRDDAGCWRWNSHKPEMHDYVRRFFLMRNEDGWPHDALRSTDASTPAATGTDAAYRFNRDHVPSVTVNPSEALDTDFSLAAVTGG